jgi:adenosylcobinamide-GDP ribazoletransferase
VLKPLFLALQFLTRLPVPSPPDTPDDQTQGQSVLYYPLVGLIIGLLLCIIYWLTQGASSLLQAALILLVWVALTGALHIDGLADLADAWVGGQGDRERTLEIMKDPSSGPLGVTAVVLLLLVKFAAIDTLVANDLWAALLLVPMISRAGLIAALQYIPYVRPQGLGSVQAANLPIQQSSQVLLAAGLFCFLFLGWDALLPLSLACACFGLLRYAFIQRLGGITGDAAGALCELLEAIVLVSLALLV